MYGSKTSTGGRAAVHRRHNLDADKKGQMNSKPKTENRDLRLWITNEKEDIRKDKTRIGEIAIIAKATAHPPTWRTLIALRHSLSPAYHRLCDAANSTPFLPQSPALQDSKGPDPGDHALHVQPQQGTLAHLSAVARHA